MINKAVIYFRGRFMDGKSMNEAEPNAQKQTKRNIQNRLKEAFSQADDAYLEIPINHPLRWIEEAIRGKLNSSTRNHSVFVKYGEELLYFESTK